jgi:UV DNA damage repair endonuclease
MIKFMQKQRIGFCCKFLESSNEKKSKQIKEAESLLNTSSTTVAWLNRQSREVAEVKLWSIMEHNLASVQRMLACVSKFPKEMHMARLGSDLLPMYTEPSWGYFWKKTDVKTYCEREFAKIGELARQHDIRLSFHPGQFCVLASIDDDIVQRSIDEFEYHADMARWMGYGSAWHDHGFKINVHISGRKGPQGIIDVLSKLSPEACNLITIENDENSWGLDDSLILEKHVALVLDVHHHLLHSGGEYIQPNDSRWRRVIDSWRGVRPVIHYSISREDVLVGHPTDDLPDIKGLLESGKVKKSKLRAHSEHVWNTASNEWVLKFWQDADIQVEAKLKNIASRALFEQAITS